MRSPLIRGARLAILFGALVLPGLPRAASAATLCVDNTPGCSDATTPLASCIPGPAYCTIQAAVTAASSSDTIDVNVGTGPYTEQVTIATSLTLVGLGTPTILAPASLPAAGDVVTIQGAGVSVEMSGFTVSGPGPSGCGSIGAGIHVLNGADANIHDNTITAIRDNPFSGCQNGVGIVVGSSSPSSTGTAIIRNNTIVDYQKNGIVVRTAGSSATIDGNTVTGMGPQTLIAQNGIQVSGGAFATVTGNDVSGHECNHVSCGPDPLTQTQSVGILLFASATGTSVAGNSVSGNDIGIYNFAPSSTINANNVLSNRYEGIFLDEGHADVTNNVIGGGNVGVDIVSFTGSAGDSDGTLTCNRIVDATEAGIRLVNEGTTTQNATATTNNNDIHDNAIGFDNQTANSTNAQMNYWGCATGANTAGCDTTIGPVDSSLPLNAPSLCAPCDAVDPCTPPFASSCGGSCLCEQRVPGAPGIGACRDIIQQCNQLSGTVCASDADCVNDPNFPNGTCVTTHCDGTTPDVCPAPRCFPAQCTVTTSTTVTTTTSSSSTSTSSSSSTTSSTAPSSCGNSFIEFGEQCDPPNQPSSACAAFGGTVCGPNCQCLPTTTTTSSSTITTTTNASTTSSSSSTTTTSTSSSTTSSSSTITTTSTSSSTTTSTPPSSCGNSFVDPGEQCDPPGLNSACGAFGGTTCGPNCQCITTTTSTVSTTSSTVVTTSTSTTSTSTSSTIATTTSSTTSTTTTEPVSTTTTVSTTSTTTTTVCSPQPENTSPTCGDMIDNDCDGAVDCADPDCSGIFPCPRASKDPTIIVFGSRGRLDRMRGHAKLAMTGVNLAALPVSVLLSDLRGPIYSDGLPAGALSASPKGTIFRFRNAAARSSGGMYDLKIKKNNDGSTYTFSFTSYGDLSRATDSHMRLQFYVGDDANAARDGRVFITLDTPWTKTPNGWRAPKDH